MPKIPVNPMDIPTTQTPMPDNVVYTGIIRVFEMAMNGDQPKLDVNGNQYMKAEIEVLEPAELRGKRIRDNYIGLPGDVAPDMDDLQRKRTMENGVRFACLLESAGYRKPATEINTDDLIGEQVTFTIKNEEFPKGSRRMVPKINDYLYK